MTRTAASNYTRVMYKAAQARRAAKAERDKAAKAEAQAEAEAKSFKFKIDGGVFSSSESAPEAKPTPFNFRYKIDKGIPVPTTGKSRYPWNDMEIGDSFLVTEPHDVQRVRQRAFEASRRLNRKFITRSEEPKSVRIWRTE